MSKTVLIVKHRGKDIPEAYIKTVVENNPSYFSYAYVDGDNINGGVDETPELSKLQEFLKDHTDNQLVMSFHDLGEEEISQDDAQPHAIASDGDKTIVQGWFDGQFENGTVEAARQVRTKLNGLLTAYDGDLDTALAALNNGKPRDYINKMGGDGSTVILLSNVEKISMFGGLKKANFPWGFVTNAYDYTEKEKDDPVHEAAPEPEEKSKGTFGGSRKFGGTGPKVTQKETPAIVNPPAPNLSAEAKALTEKPWSPNMITPPKHITGSKQLKNWYKHQCGFIPDDYQSRPAMPDKKSREHSILLARADKNTTPKAVKTEDTLPVENKKSDLHKPPILNSMDTKAFSTWREKSNVEKYVDGSSETILKPEEIQAMEKRIPFATEQLGMKDGIIEVFPWSYSTMLDLAKNHPATMAALFAELRFTHMKLLSTATQTLKKEFTGKIEKGYPEKAEEAAAPVMKKTGTFSGRGRAI